MVIFYRVFDLCRFCYATITITSNKSNHQSIVLNYQLVWGFPSTYCLVWVSTKDLITKRDKQKVNDTIMYLYLFLFLQIYFIACARVRLREFAHERDAKRECVCILILWTYSTFCIQDISHYRNILCVSRGALAAFFYGHFCVIVCLQRLRSIIIS